MVSRVSEVALDIYERGITPLVEGREAKWFVTGAAGFIGSHLVSCLLKNGQEVVGIDNFSTGRKENLENVRGGLSKEEQGKFLFIECDLCEPERYRESLQGAEFVLHQAALGSVPRSIKDPAATNRANVDGFVKIAVEAAAAGVSRFVYASSSSVYGDHPGLPKVESEIGAPLSPYAVSKRANELYGAVFAKTYSIPFIGLRYFNVFGPRQDPEGAYAAVIPRWIGEMLNGSRRVIFGDGTTSRDFCFVGNVLQMNIRAALHEGLSAEGHIFNVGAERQTDLKELHHLLLEELRSLGAPVDTDEPRFDDFRDGDVKHSLADLSHAHEKLGYEVAWDVREGIRETVRWFSEHSA